MRERKGRGRERDREGEGERGRKGGRDRGEGGGRGGREGGREIARTLNYLLSLHCKCCNPHEVILIYLHTHTLTKTCLTVSFLISQIMVLKVSEQVSSFNYL